MFIMGLYKEKEILVNSDKIIEIYEENGEIFAVYEYINSCNTVKLDYGTNNLKVIQEMFKVGK